MKASKTLLGKPSAKETLKPKLGSGERFDNLVNKLKSEGKSEESASAIAASIGRHKYGKKKFQKLAAKGKLGY